MAIVKRQADVQLTELTTGAPVEYDTFAEVATELANIASKLDLITITSDIDLDSLNLDSLTAALGAGTAGDFETALITEASELPDGTVTLTSLANIGHVNDFEMSLIN